MICTACQTVKIVQETDTAAPDYTKPRLRHQTANNIKTVRLEAIPVKFYTICESNCEKHSRD